MRKIFYEYLFIVKKMFKSVTTVGFITAILVVFTVFCKFYQDVHIHLKKERHNNNIEINKVFDSCSAMLLLQQYLLASGKF